MRVSAGIALLDEFIAAHLAESFAPGLTCFGHADDCTRFGLCLC